MTEKTQAQEDAEKIVGDLLGFLFALLLADAKLAKVEEAKDRNGLRRFLRA